MQLDIYKIPEPLQIGEGKTAFRIRLRRFSGSDVAAIIDAISTGSLDAISAAISRIIIGWEGVAGPDGAPLPFEEEKEGVTVKNLDAFFGAAGPGIHVQVIHAVIGFVGIPTKDLDGLLKVLGTYPTPPPTGGKSESKEGDAASSASDTPKTVSDGSSS